MKYNFKSIKSEYMYVFIEEEDDFEETNRLMFVLGAHISLFLVITSMATMYVHHKNLENHVVAPAVQVSQLHHLL